MPPNQGGAPLSPRLADVLVVVGGECKGLSRPALLPAWVGFALPDELLDQVQYARSGLVLAGEEIPAAHIEQIPAERVKQVEFLVVFETLSHPTILPVDAHSLLQVEHTLTEPVGHVRNQDFDAVRSLLDLAPEALKEAGKVIKKSEVAGRLA